jgi:hypothetical protein
MAKKATTKVYRSIQTIMGDPAMKAKLNNLVDEAVRQRQRVDDAKETTKQLRETAVKDLQMDPAQFNEYVSRTYSNDYAQAAEKLEAKAELLRVVMGLLPDHSSHKE